MSDQDKRVLVLSKAKEGKIHDKRQLDAEKLVDCVPDEVPIHVNTARLSLKIRKYVGWVEERNPTFTSICWVSLSFNPTYKNSYPSSIAIHVDLGFQGLQKEFVNIKIPDKKPRGKELTEQQKHSNREKSSDVFDNPFGERVKCEHTISGIKRYKSVTAVYRNRIRDLDDRFMLTAAGLWNFYLMAA